ncbi:hypothetical protein H0H87_008093 [Tephrocybe sp. NHM501043]|nr:hypothetical protein H0H87_008093 [Tephrocybe sp. NHM501043]
MDTKDVSSIIEGSSPNITASPTAFLGYTFREVVDWFDTNVTKPVAMTVRTSCLLVLDDQTLEDNSCVFVCNQDAAPGEIHSLRCTFDLAVQNAIACDLLGISIEDGALGCFMRSGVTMTKANLELVNNGGLYFEGGEVKLDQYWRDLGEW